MLKYNLDLVDVAEDEQKLLNFLRMEKWIADRPDHPGEAAKQWLKDLYQQNKLAKNELELGGRRVDLRRITMPVLNVYAKDDHIIPPATSRALGGLVGTQGLHRARACPAAMSACSSAGERRSCSDRASPNGWPSASSSGQGRAGEDAAVRNKIVSPDEAVAILRDGDTVSVSGR